MIARVGSIILSAWARPSFLALAFAILALPLALVLATITPLGGVYDETEHAAKAESLSAGQLFGHRGQSYWYDLSVQQSAGFDVDATFLTAHEVWALAKVTEADVTQAMSRRWAHARTYVEAAFVARYFPVFYVPAALGIAGAKLVRVIPYYAFLDARLANLAVFAVLGIAALLLARRGRMLLFCVLALPMTLSLAGSINQDGLFIACSVLAIALLTRVVEDAGAAVSGCPRIMAALVIAMIGLAKPPYVALAALLLLPLPCARPGILWRLGLATITVLPGLLWAAYAMRFISVPWPPMPPYAPGPLWPGPADATFHSIDAAAQLRVLAANPFRILSLTIDNLASDAFWRVTAGSFPAGMFLPGIVYWTWTVAFAAAGIDAVLAHAPHYGVQLRWRDALLILLTLSVVLIAICVSQYLTWTKVGAAHVDMAGQMGRYLLPLLPVLVLGAPVFRRPFLKGATLLLFIPVAIAAVVSVVEVPRAVVDAFYIR